jgi:hypothetical protein
LILNYRPVYKQWRIRGLNLSGLEQLYMLQSLPEEQLLTVSLKRLRELERKFPGEKAPPEEKLLTGGFVSSPIPLDIAKKMSDRAWLSAIKKYKDARGHKEFLKGGSAQLGGVLTQVIKDDPARFHKLIDLVPVDIDQDYVRAFIRGFSESTAPSTWTFHAVRHFLPSINLESRTEISWVLEKKARDLPLDLAKWLSAIVHENIGTDELWWSQGTNHGDAFQNYLNSCRGAAFNALIKYYQQRADSPSVTKQWELIEFVAVDPSTTLRAGAIHELTFMIKHDRLRAIELFEKLIFDHDILLTLMPTSEFIYWAFSGNFLRLLPYIIQMANSEIPNVREQGAQLASVGLISSSVLESDEAIAKAAELVENCIAGDVNLRRGAAKVFSNNLANSSVEDVCEKYVSELLSDEDDEIRGAIDRAFTDFDGSFVFSKRNLIEKYARSRNVIELSYAEFMLNYGMLDPKWAINIIGSQIRNSELATSGWHSGIDELVRLVLKIYTNAADDGLREEAMDIFDQLLKRFSRYVHKALSEWDIK